MRKEFFQGGFATGSYVVRGLLFLGLCIQGAVAAPVYVTDKLQLGVHAAADTSDRAFTRLKSGDEVNILDENLYYAKVSLADGREGWVKKNYLVPDKPAILVVAEVKAELEETRAQLASLQKSLGEREQSVAAMEKRIVEEQAGLDASAQELANLRVENRKLSDWLGSDAFNVPGNLFLLAVGACLVIGFLGAWYLFDHRSRLRHGGYRVH